MNRWTDSFQKVTDFTQLYDDVHGAATRNVTFVRTGTYSVRVNGGSWLQKNFGSLQTWTMGVALYIDSLPTAETGLLAIGDTGTIQVSFSIDNAGAMRVRRGQTLGGGGGTLLGTPTGTIGTGVFHYFEMKVTVSTTVGTVDIQVDGTNVLSLTGQNTQQSANATANQVFIGGISNTGGNFYWNDYYINDSTGSHNTGFWGDTVIQFRRTTANGATNQFTNSFTAVWQASTNMLVGQTILDSNGNVQRVQSISGVGQTAGSHPTWATTGGSTTTDNPGANQVVWVCLGTGSNPGIQNWMCVNEIPPDGNGSYVTDATVGHIDLYTFETVTGSTVFTVNDWMRAEKDDAATRTIRAECRSGGSNFDNGVDFTLTLNSYGYYMGAFETDPNTGVAWSVSGVNGAQFGVKTTT